MRGSRLLLACPYTMLLFVASTAVCASCGSPTAGTCECMRVCVFVCCVCWYTSCALRCSLHGYTHPACAFLRTAWAYAPPAIAPPFAAGRMNKLASLRHFTCIRFVTHISPLARSRLPRVHAHTQPFIYTNKHDTMPTHSTTASYCSHIFICKPTHSAHTRLSDRSSRAQRTLLSCTNGGGGVAGGR